MLPIPAIVARNVMKSMPFMLAMILPAPCLAMSSEKPAGPATSRFILGSLTANCPPHSRRLTVIDRLEDRG